MCNGHHRSLFRGSLSPYQNSIPENGDASVVDNLRGRLEETELRLAQVRAREAELSRLLEEMKRLVSVMEILENYLKRQYTDRQEYVKNIPHSRCFNVKIEVLSNIKSQKALCIPR
ncbi:protein SKIP34 [Benincasa hispida]|uniref:protein SKIP34 n=1 Tax=Benincasa hispida TaxID=102211 RepID=UPI00190087D0|nr:protein SKIP34 [Benincasa hispida]